jgi:hypothetical protein
VLAGAGDDVPAARLGDSRRIVFKQFKHQIGAPENDIAHIRDCAQSAQYHPGENASAAIIALGV